MKWDRKEIQIMNKSNLKLDSNKQFYPTPKELADKMVNSIKDWREINTVLEPSAGTGNILKALAIKEKSSYMRFEVDCIEIQPELRAILKENFSRENYYELSSEEKQQLFNQEPTIVGDDFLKFDTFKHYDLIIMNPPFNSGATHLLKALEMQKNGGTIVCLLNAETIRNPYSNERKQLANLLDKYNAEIEYIENSFVNADNPTAVEVALIKIFIPNRKNDDGVILQSLIKGKEIPSNDFVVNALDVTDYIQSAINRYNFEVEIGLKLLKEYESLKPYMLSSFQSSYEKPILEFAGDMTPNEYIKKVRYKYWEALLCNPKFVGKLPSNLQDEYRQKIYKLKDYDFSEFNINQLALDMACQLKESIEDKIIELFDKFTSEHSYYPECSKTIHYYNGWKTNKAHKIGKKIIIPHYFLNYRNEYDEYLMCSKLNDIEKVLNFLDGKSSNVDCSPIIKEAIKNGVYRNIQLHYFKITLYKKGTMHITFNDEYLPLIDRFNIFAGKKKSWLPPSYGKVGYENMNEDEKSVIDSFQGEEEYNKILQNSNYYLAPVCNGNDTLMLED